MPVLKQHANRDKKHVTVYRSGKPGARPEVDTYSNRAEAFKGALAAFMMGGKPFEEVLSHLEIKGRKMILHGPGASTATIEILVDRPGQKFEATEASDLDMILSEIEDRL